MCNKAVRLTGVRGDLSCCSLRTTTPSRGCSTAGLTSTSCSRGRGVWTRASKVWLMTITMFPWFLCVKYIEIRWFLRLISLSSPPANGSGTPKVVKPERKNEVCNKLWFMLCRVEAGRVNVKLHCFFSVIKVHRKKNSRHLNHSS